MEKCLVYITDDNYVIPTKVSIKSAIYNYNGEKLIIYVIATKITDIHREELENLDTEKDNVSVIVIIKNEDFTNLGADHHYVSRAALYKFQLPIIFPDMEKILYVDGDTLFYPNWEEIYDIDISAHYGAAVQDMIAVLDQKWNERLDIENYYNSGVLFLNLKKMRQDNVTEKLIESKKNDNDSSFMDQNVINRVLSAGFKSLEVKYNYLLTVEEKYTPDEMCEFFNETFENVQISSARIMHLTGEMKVWKDCMSSSYDRWIGYLDSSDYMKCVKAYICSEKEKYKKELAILNEKNKNLERELQAIQDRITYVERHTAWNLLSRCYHKIKK